MTDSKNIAALLGPTMIAIGISEALTFRIFATNIAPLKSSVFTIVGRVAGP